jgi:hypothetical protein
MQWLVGCAFPWCECDHRNLCFCVVESSEACGGWKIFDLILTCVC